MFKNDRLDAFTRKAYQAIEGDAGLMPIDVIVTAQVYIDIFNLVDDDVEAERLTICQNLASIKSRLNHDASQRLELFPSGGYSPQQQSATTKLHTQTKQAISQKLEVEVQKQHQTKKDVWDCVPMEEHLLTPLFKVMPVLAGVQSRNLLERFYRHGIGSCNQGFVMMSVAHLYTACRKTGLLRNKWEDLEFAMEHLGRSNLGLRDASNTSAAAVSCAKDYGIALGVSVVEYSKERKEKRMGFDRVPLPPAKEVFKRKARIEQPSHYVRAKIESFQKEAQGMIEHGAMKFAMEQMAPSILSDPAANCPSGLKEQWKSCKKLNSTELLGLLKDSLTTDELQLCFDWSNHFTVCEEFLAQVCEDELNGHPISSYADLIDGYPVFVKAVDDILWQAAHAQQRSCAALKATKLSDVAKAIQKHIDASGSHAIDMAKRHRESQLRHQNAELESTQESHGKTIVRDGKNVVKVADVGAWLRARFKGRRTE